MVVGTIMDSLNKNKKLIIVAIKKKKKKNKSVGSLLNI